MEGKQATVRSLARELGLSFSTVAAALRHDPVVAVQTQQRVWAAARRQGYEPHPAAASLAALRQRQPGVQRYNLAYVTAPLDPSRRSFRQELYEAAATRAEELGYTLIWTELGVGEGGGEWHRVLRHRGVAGLILNCRGLQEMPADFPVDRYALVKVDEGLPQLACDGVRPGAFQETWALLQRTVDYGYQRIGVVMPEHRPRRETDHARLGAMLSFQAEVAEAVRVEIFRYVFNEPYALRSWLEAVQPEVVVSFHSSVRYALQEAGWSVPGQVALAVVRGFMQEPEVAGPRHLDGRMGREAVHLLDQRLRHGELGLPEYPKLVTLTGEWVDGDSLPRRDRSR